MQSTDGWEQAILLRLGRPAVNLAVAAQLDRYGREDMGSEVAKWLVLGFGVAWMADPATNVLAADVVPPASERFAAADVDEVPDFRRHVVPLLGRLGCNGRACHGSFQGQGGLRLSLFVYDFAADHAALVGGEEPRANVAEPSASLMLYKPTHGDEHGGGERMKPDDWEYRLLRRWIESGARGVAEGDADLVSIAVEPGEVVLARDEETVPLRVLATWSNGTVEDVTPLCRYQTNDESVAEVDADGVVTSRGAGDTHVVAFYDAGVAVVPVLRPVSEFAGSRYPDVSAPTRVDELVVAKLRKLGIVPSEPCSDAEFLRRASLDVTGTLPTPDEIRAFVADPAADKRRRKVDELLERPTYVARWTTKLCDITGNSPKHFQDQAPPDEYARHWYEWIARRVRENVPYDELVAGIVLGRSRGPGEGYLDFAARETSYYRDENPVDFTARDTMPYYWARHGTRTPEERALHFSYAFLGVRIECAQCHKHPSDRWTQQDFEAFTALFEPIGFGVAPPDRKLYNQLIKELGDEGNQAQRVRKRLDRARRGEIVPWLEVFLVDEGRVERDRVLESTFDVAPRVLGGPAIDLAAGDDPRHPLMDWMRRPDNAYFARVFVNRVWAEYFGRGIVDPPDDLNAANPPVNAALLDHLTEGFVSHGFDMKWLHREIVGSEAYQRSARANETNRLDERNFGRAVPRRMPAPVLFDAIAQATAGSEALALAATDVDERAVGPQGGAFVGRYNVTHYASTVFGRSSRVANCDCSASNEPNLLQAIYLQNDKDVLAAIEAKDGWLQEVRRRFARRTPDEPIDVAGLVEEAFLRTLSRPPTTTEAERCARHFDELGNPNEAMHDLLWSLLNTREFVTNH
jgi:hypothetical protein